MQECAGPGGHLAERPAVIRFLPILMLAGCGATVQTIKVPVPVPCQAVEPVRPVMPTEALKPGVKLDTFAKSAMAEIERREGYEGKLVAALRSCITPG